MTALRRRAVRHLVVCLATAVVVMVGIVAAGWTPHVEVIIALAIAVAVASVAVRQLGDSTDVLRWPRRRPTVAIEGGGDARVGFLEHSLRRSGEDDTAFAMRVRPVLVAVSTHRLRRAGIDIDAEPDAAQQLLGDDAWDVLTGPARLPITRRRLEQAIDRIEQL